MENIDDSEIKQPQVHEALLGITAINQDLTVFDFEDILIRKDYKSIAGVRLLSGGKAGRHIFHANFVGKGALTAAILTIEIPTTRQILRAIQELNVGPNSGILIIHQNNNEIFNFGLAADIAAKDLGVKVKLLTLDDDKRIVADKRSVGVVFLFKILGAMAEEGRSFEDIVQFYNTHRYIITALIKPTDQTSKHSELFDDESSCCNINQKTFSTLNVVPGSPIAVLISFYKNMNKVKTFALIKDIVEELEYVQEKVIRVYVGASCWIVSEKNSLSILPVIDDDVLKYLDAPCGAIGWHEARQYLPEVHIPPMIAPETPDINPGQIEPSGPKFTDFELKTLLMATQFSCDAISSCKRQLNLIDTEKSGGNLGSRLKRAAETVSGELTKITWTHPDVFFKYMSFVLDTTIGGPMGAMYGLMFDSASQTLRKHPKDSEMTAEIWLEIFASALQNLNRYCDEETGRYNMYFPLCTFESIMRQLTDLEEEKYPGYFLQTFMFGVSEVEKAAQNTRQSEHIYPDAGAHAVGIWMRAVCEAVKYMCLTRPQLEALKQTEQYGESFSAV